MQKIVFFFPFFLQMFFYSLIPLPVTNWASDKEKFIPNYSVEIIIFFILWSVEIIIFFILWSQHPYYDFNIHIMISTSNFSKLWSQQQISPNYDLNSVCVCTNTIFFKTKTKTYYFSHLHSLEFHLLTTLDHHRQRSDHHHREPVVAFFQPVCGCQCVLEGPEVTPGYISLQM